MRGVRYIFAAAAPSMKQVCTAAGISSSRSKRHFCVFNGYVMSFDFGFNKSSEARNSGFVRVASTTRIWIWVGLVSVFPLPPLCLYFYCSRSLQQRKEAKTMLPFMEIVTTQDIMYGKLEQYYGKFQASFGTSLVLLNTRLGKTWLPVENGRNIREPRDQKLTYEEGFIDMRGSRKWSRISFFRVVPRESRMDTFEGLAFHILSKEDGSIQNKLCFFLKRIVCKLKGAGWVDHVAAATGGAVRVDKGVIRWLRLLFTGLLGCERDAGSCWVEWLKFEQRVITSDRLGKRGLGCVMCGCHWKGSKTLKLHTGIALFV